MRELGKKSSEGSPAPCIEARGDAQMVHPKIPRSRSLDCLATLHHDTKCTKKRELLHHEYDHSCSSYFSGGSVFRELQESLSRLEGILKKRRLERTNEPEKMNEQKPTFSWIDTRCERRESSIHGDGVFAITTIRKGEVVAAFGGYPMTSDQIFNLPQKVRYDCLQIHNDPSDLSKALYLSGGTVKELDESDVYKINHSCSPNVGLRGQMLLEARREIQVGEELTFNYATTEMSEKSKWEFDCHCGASACSGTIHGELWKDPIFQRANEGYFSQHIQRAIDKLTQDQ
jgi:uncharacterized protein